VRGDGKKVNAYGNAYRGYQCPQRRTIPFTHRIKRWSAHPCSLLPTRSATRAAYRTTRGRGLLDKSVDSRGSAKLCEGCLRAAGLGMDGEAAKRGQ